MPSIFGALDLPDTVTVTNNPLGEQVIYDEITKFINRVNEELNRDLGVFVAEVTEAYTRKYKLPGSGYLEKVGRKTRGGAAKQVGSWDVAWPLEEWERGIAGDRVSLAYMTLKDLDIHVQGVAAANVNTVRFELFKRLFNNAATSFVDEVNGTLTIQPLANGDSVVYPPIMGATTGATENHYLGANYVAAAIDDSHNPYVTIKDELAEHFGETQGEDDIVVFINPAEEAVTEDLTDFDYFGDSRIKPGANTDTLINIPVNLPGKIIGRTNGVWVVSYRAIPASWLLGTHLRAPAPLIKRVDTVASGLPRDLALVAQDLNHPFKDTTWSHRFGFGCGNRLNGVVLDLSNADSDYDIPALYA
jgi:hypothetical protein